MLALFVDNLVPVRMTEALVSLRDFLPQVLANFRRDKFSYWNRRQPAAWEILGCLACAISVATDLRRGKLEY